MARLRVRSGADIHLADAFEAPGCPLCREVRRTERLYLESILSESVNDIAFRRGLDAARGFCGTHARAILDADRARAGSLGASILLRATLVARLRDVEAVAQAGGRGRARRVQDAQRAPACPACERVARSDDASVETVVRQAEDAGWAEAAAAAPFCLDHLLALMGRRPAPASWAGVEARQLERLRDLRDRLERFAHASAQDRRHLQTDDQRASVDEAADLIAGARREGQDPAIRVEAPVPGAGGPDAAAARRPPVPGASAVLLTGPYGAGKTTLAIELADMLDDAGASMAAMDLDWLGWYAAPVDWDEHEDPRVTLRHVAQLSRTYLDAGVRHLVLAGSVPSGAIDGIREAVGVPLRVVRLAVPASTLRHRLEGDPNASRGDDLARALATLAAGTPDNGVDLVVDADRPVGIVAQEVLGVLGWLPG